MLRRILTFFTPFLISFTLLSCGDDSPSGPNLSEAPEAPTLDRVEMDFSIFQQADTWQSIQTFNPEEIHKSLDRDAIRKKMEPFSETADYTAYEQAALFAYFAEFWFQSMGNLPAAFFQEHQWGDPEVDGDTWIWEWHYAVEGESLTMTITAETVNNERHWELRYSTEGMEEDLDNALLIASQIRLDGSGGAWQLFNFLEEVAEPVFQVEYDFEDDITTRVDMTFDEESEGRFLYQRDGELSTLDMWDIYDGGHSTLEWNNETGVGSIQSESYRDGNRVCWDENFQDAEC